MSLSKKQLQTWITFIRTYAKVQGKLAEEMQNQHDIPLTWYDVLVHLYHAPCRRLRMQDLAEAVILSGSGLTRLLDRMIEADLVERTTCAEDRRVIFATLTPKGTDLIEEILPQHQQRIEQYFARHLDEEELDIMAGALQRILSACQVECGKKDERLVE